MKERILVIDDDENICEVARIALEAEDFCVDTAYDGESGMQKILSGDYGAVLLDIMLPKLDGWEICRRVRNGQFKKLPIIMLTARGEEVDRVLGLELGADDYITKPFSPREMVARVKAVLRRTERYNNEDYQELQYDNLNVDMRSHTAKLNDIELDLTPKELSLLRLLLSRPETTFSREELLRELWGFDKPVAVTRTVDEHIKRLRAKLAQIDPLQSYIQTVWGSGYKFEVKNND
jgi:DNA-binding response OmpR family regulator